MDIHKGDYSLMSDTLENAKKLLQMNVGDPGRLEYIVETLSKNKELFTSDKNYLDNLSAKYLENTIKTENSNETEVLQLKAKIHELEVNCECNSAKMQMLSSIFSPPKQKIADLGVLFARFGIGFSFLWAGFGKVSDPVGFGQMLQSMMGISPEMAPMMASLIGILELMAGVFFVIGFLTRFSSIFATGPAIWKDPSILGLALLLMLYGSGKFGIDSKISSILSNH